MRQRQHQLPPPLTGAHRERPLQQPDRLALLRRRLRREQIAEPLDLRQIEAAVQERASGELPRLGGAQARRCRPSAATTE